MPEIQNSYVYPQTQMTQGYFANVPQPQMPTAQAQPRTLKDEFVHQHKRNGLFERLYNGIKNLTGLGMGSKKLKKEIEQAENGELDEAKVRADIDKYRKSQVNGAQAFGDLISIGASGLSFFGLINSVKEQQAVRKLNKKFGSNKFGAALVGKSEKEMMKIARDRAIAMMTGSKSKLTIFAAINAALVGGIAKSIIMSVNRIGSKYVDKKDYNGAENAYDRAAYKYAKKDARKERGKNFLSGMINGLMLPVSMLGGGFVGVPLYLIGNSLNRYFVANGKERNKSFKGYIDNLKNDSITHAALAIGAGIPLAKHGHFSAVFDKNLKKAYDSLMKQPYLNENPYGGNTAYQEIENLLFAEPELKALMEGKVPYKEFSHWERIFPPRDSEIKEAKNISQDLKDYITEKFGEGSKIIKQAGEDKYLIKNADNTEVWYDITSYDSTRYLTVEEQIEGLIDKNIFAVKLKQIQGAEKEQVLVWTMTKEADPLVKKLQEGCPSTRDIAQATEDINNALGGGYKILANLGTGTVAETYLAKDAGGKEVCIKILKKGMSAEKIAKDKEKTIELIQKMEGKTDAEKNYLIKNIEDLAEGIKKELDLANEMKMADELRKCTKTANIVKGLKCENNVYVMEKADGVSLKNLLEYTKGKDKVERDLQRLNDELSKATTPQERSFIQSEMNRIKAEQKEILSKIDNISEEDLDYIIKNYMDVLVEQLYKVDKSGRVLHADIHPGNIFINLEALRNKKGKLFTLIDTGNTIKLDALHAEQSMKLTNYINNADTKDIAKYFVEDADLSASGLTKELAAEKIEQELNKVFFDSETRLDAITNTEIINLTSNIMKDLKIMPGQTQLNLEKAKISAEKSFDVLINMFQNNTEKAIEEKGFSIGGITTFISKSNKQSEIQEQYRKLQSEQENRNLWQLFKSPKKFFEYRKNPNYKEKNSEEFLRYRLKQQITKPEKKDTGIDFKVGDFE